MRLGIAYALRSLLGNNQHHLNSMQCPECKSTHINKNGKKRGKQNYICVNCQRQFIDDYQESQGYSDNIRHECLMMYVNGMGLRAIGKVKGIHHTTILNWLKQVGELLPDAYAPEAIPQVGELDELETFIGCKKTKFGFGQSSQVASIARRRSSSTKRKFYLAPLVRGFKN